MGRLPTERTGHGYEKHPKIMSWGPIKLKLIISNKIASLGYVQEDEAVNHIRKYYNLIKKEYKIKPKWGK